MIIDPWKVEVRRSKVGQETAEKQANTLLYIGSNAL